jgi:hypothetical protein
MRIEEYNTETHEVIERDATAEEIAQAELDAAEITAFHAANEAKATAKAALLDRLGISAEEAALLLA